MSRINSNETENANETDLGNRKVWSFFGKFLGIFAYRYCNFLCIRVFKFSNKNLNHQYLVYIFLQ